MYIIARPFILSAKTSLMSIPSRRPNKFLTYGPVMKIRLDATCMPWIRWTSSDTLICISNMHIKIGNLYRNQDE